MASPEYIDHSVAGADTLETDYLEMIDEWRMVYGDLFVEEDSEQVDRFFTHVAHIAQSRAEVARDEPLEQAVVADEDVDEYGLDLNAWRSDDNPDDGYTDRKNLQPVFQSWRDDEVRRYYDEFIAQTQT